MQFSNLLGCTMQTVMVAGQVERLSPMLYRFVRARDTVMEINRTRASSNTKEDMSISRLLADMRMFVLEILHHCIHR